MKAFSRIAVAGALMGLAGCSSLPGAGLGGTFGVESFLKNALGGGDGFNSALAREYQLLAESAANNDVNWMDATAYVRRARAAANGETVLPWDPAALGLGGEAATLYNEVSSAVSSGRDKNPRACAQAQALYDSYLEELSEGDHSCSDPAQIRAKLNEAVAACGYSGRSAAAGSSSSSGSASASGGGITTRMVEKKVITNEQATRMVKRVISRPVQTAAVNTGAVVSTGTVVEAPVVAVPQQAYDACTGVALEPNCTCATSNGFPVISCVQQHVEQVVERVQQVVTAAPAPVAALPASGYTVYFGFDRSDLTAEASNVIADIAAAFRAYGNPLLSVMGHTDTSGSKAYNQRLAERRAQAVANALAAQGVPRGNMRVGASSELRPAVATGDSVREALNRRVEISIQ